MLTERTGTWQGRKPVHLHLHRARARLPGVLDLENTKLSATATTAWTLDWLAAVQTRQLACGRSSTRPAPSPRPTCTRSRRSPGTRCGWRTTAACRARRPPRRRGSHGQFGSTPRAPRSPGSQATAGVGVPLGPPLPRRPGRADGQRAGDANGPPAHPPSLHVRAMARTLPDYRSDLFCMVPAMGQYQLVDYPLEWSAGDLETWCPLGPACRGCDVMRPRRRAPF
jgi:hypothetical protein